MDRHGDPNDDPKRGLHAQCSLGFAVLTGNYASYVRGLGEKGFGLMVGVGNEWWVSDLFSVGVLGRITAGFMRGEALGTLHDNVFLPALLATGTMN